MADETPLPAPIEAVQQTGSSVDEIIARAMSGVVEAEAGGGESPPEPSASGSPEPPSQEGSSEAPDSEAAPPSGESEAPETASPSESGDSPSLELAGQKFSKSELQAIVEAHANREAFQKAAQEQADKIRQQVEHLETARKQIEAENAKIAKERQDNETYAQYLQWLNEGNSGDIREFTRQTGLGVSRQKPAPPADQEDLDARIARVLQKTLGQERQQSHQHEIKAGIDDWVASAVAAEPALKGREATYQSDILHRLVVAASEQNLTPFDFSSTQIKNFLRQYAREAAANEKKLSETTLADRLDKASRTKEKLPVAPRTQGTPLPVQPNGFKLDLKKLAEESPDTDTYFLALEKSLKEQADELSSMANRMG